MNTNAVDGLFAERRSMGFELKNEAVRPQMDADTLHNAFCELDLAINCRRKHGRLVRALHSNV